MTLLTRRTIVTNDSGVTQDFLTKRLTQGESFELDQSDLMLWRDEPTISGAIGSGDLIVSNGETIFSTPAQGAFWFYGLPHLPISSVVVPGIGKVNSQLSDDGLEGIVTISGEDLVDVNDVGSVISISTTAASPTDLANVSGTLTQDLATLSGVVTDTFNYVLVEVIPEIESPATTVQQGFSEQDNTLSTTTSTTFQQKLRLTADTTLIVSGTEPEPFRLQWYWEWGYSGANAEFNGILELDDFDILAEIQWRPTATSNEDYQSSSGFEDMLLSSGTHTFDLDYRSTANGKTARIRRARLSVIPLTLSDYASDPPLRGNP